MGLMRSRNLRAIGISAAIAVGASLGVLTPAAMAAPANNEFAQRASLGDALPVHVEESNEGATRETGEHISEFAKGRSIWWEWESPITGWTTVSTCESGFPTVVNVFEGTELGHLTALADEHSNGDEGPACPGTGTTFTFDATQGDDYVIGADGNDFYPPPLPPEEPHIPSGEGTIKLSIEATPPPPNDDFAAAARIGGNFRETRESPFEEPNDDRYFWEEVSGYNWGATKQAGEPDHAGDPGGASVWYAWTPSESGEAWISLQTPGGPKLLALYKGSTLGDLIPIASSAESFPSFSADVIAGTEYRIAVDGSHSENPLEPSRGSFMGSFALAIQMKLPPLPGSSLSEPPLSEPPATTHPGPSVESRAPVVELSGHQVDAKAGSATFRFDSSTASARFECKLDRKPFKACSSPFRAKGLKSGRHRFAVVAVFHGTSSARPAVVHFTVPAPQRHHHAAG
jgi:hypothetical protein